MKVSVALCTFNGEAFLNEQLNSIANQTRKVDELIVCDDISTDKTWSILTEFQKNALFPVKLFRNEKRLGVMLNFQQALASCTGDIVLLSDQDDIWLENKVEFILDYFEKQPEVELLFSNALLFGNELLLEKKKTLFDLLDFYSLTQKAFSDGYGLEVSQTLGRVSGFTIALKNELLNEILPFEEKYSYFIHDRQMVLFALEKKVIDYTDVCLTKYRIHETQTSGIIEFLNKNNLIAKKDGLLELPPISEDVIDFLKIKGFSNPKFDFSDKRRKMIRSLIAPILILININHYKSIYKNYFTKAIRYDFDAFLTLNKRRLKNVFS